MTDKVKAWFILGIFLASLMAVSTCAHDVVVTECHGKIMFLQRGKECPPAR